MNISLLELFYSYWPKIIAGIWFAIFNEFIFTNYGKQKRHYIRNFIVLFFISSGFLAIVGEISSYFIYKYIIEVLNVRDDHFALLIILSIIIDTTFVFFGGNCYSRYTNNRNFLGATIYLEYVCIERLCSIVGISALTYFLLFILFHLILFAIQRNDLKYLFSPNTIYWKRIHFYLLSLFYVLDILYGAYFIFPELAIADFTVQNLLWLDGLALLNSAFVCGYLKINYIMAREHDEKLSYLKKLQHSQEDIIISLAQISEAKSGETGQHIRRVAEYSKLVAEQMHLTSQDVEIIRIAAMMHDIGKLMISQDILDKPGRLTEEEYTELQTRLVTLSASGMELRNIISLSVLPLASIAE